MQQLGAHDGWHPAIIGGIAGGILGGAQIAGGAHIGGAGAGM